jgi:uncharacterized protein YegJ (DUF2314 family)
MDDKQLQLLENASKIARRNFKFCWREQFWNLRRSEHNCQTISFLCAISDEVNGEQVRERFWLSNLMFDGHFAYGTVDVEPSIIKNIEVGAVCTVPFDRIEDWMYVLEGKVYGGYTVNVRRSLLKPKERSLYDKSWGLEFGDPLYTNKYPVFKKPVEEEVKDEDEGPPTKFFGITITSTKKKKEKPAKQEVVQDPTEHINREYDHPDAILRFDKYKAMFKGHPYKVNQVDENGWTPLLNHALAGNRHIVELLLQCGADRSATTQHGETAMDLAKKMGWLEVVAKLR